MLNGCRALDFTDEKGFVCGKILADLGVDVIKVERPNGDPSRRMGPFWKDVPHPEKSLGWLAYNANKRGITLNIETTDGREIARELVKSADFVVESFPPGYLEGRGLDYSTLKEINPGLVHVSITPFGQKGPYEAFRGCDLVVMSMSGLLYLTGDADRAPLNIGLPQSHLLAGADAAVGAMIGYYHREMTGRGQHVDVSMQQSAAWFLANTVPCWELARMNPQRVGAMRSMNARATTQRQVWPCRDGYVFFFMLGGESGAKPFRRLVKWMDDEGMGDEHLRSIQWELLDWGMVTQESLDRISQPIERFFMSRTRKQVQKAAEERNIAMYCLSSMEDLVYDKHLRDRQFWIDVEHPEFGMKLPLPRQFAEMSEQPQREPFRAPLIGEHNAEVFGELGLSSQDLVMLEGAGVI